ncbi:hypothetical protein M427DRAFT_51888, partial [Gonapodya prolifera JEL478]
MDLDPSSDRRILGDARNFHNQMQNTVFGMPIERVVRTDGRSSNGDVAMSELNPEAPEFVPASATASLEPHWLLRLPAEIFWHKIVFPFVPPVSLYAHLSRLNRAFRRHLLPFIERVPAYVTVVLTDETDEEFFDPRTKTRRIQDPGFHVPRTPQILSPLEQFHYSAISPAELTRRGFATSAEKRGSSFQTAFPWRFQGGLHRSDRTSAQATPEVSTRLPIAARLSVPLVWRQAPRQNIPVQVYRRIANLPALILDSVESMLRRSVMASWDTLEVRYGEGAHGLSLERIARTLNVHTVIVDMPDTKLKWDGSGVPGCRNLSMEILSMRQLDGLKLEEWVDMDSLTLELDGPHEEDMDVVNLFERLAIAEKDALAEAQHLVEKTEVARRKAPLKELELMPSSRGMLLRADVILKTVQSFQFLVSLKIFDWFLSDEAFDPFAVENDRTLYDLFHALPNHLQHLREFGPVLYIPQNFFINAARPQIEDGTSYPRIKALCVDLPADEESFPPTMREDPPLHNPSFWYTFGSDISSSMPGLETISVSSVELTRILRDLADMVTIPMDDAVHRIVVLIEALVRGLLGLDGYAEPEGTQAHVGKSLPRRRLHTLRHLEFEIGEDVVTSGAYTGQMEQVFNEGALIDVRNRYGLEISVFVAEPEEDDFAEMAWGMDDVEVDSNDGFFEDEDDWMDFLDAAGVYVLDDYT